MKFTEQEWFPESLYNNWLADSSSINDSLFIVLSYDYRKIL